jgi:hypothetical protein
MNRAFASSFSSYLYICRPSSPSACSDVRILAALSLLTPQGNRSARCARPCGAFELRLFGCRHSRVQEEI